MTNFVGISTNPAAPPLTAASINAAFAGKIDAVLAGQPNGIAQLDRAMNITTAPPPGIAGGDDAVTLLAVIVAMLAAGGGKLILQAGTYTFKRKLVIPAVAPGHSRVQIVGQGMDTTGIRPGVSMDALIECDQGFTTVSDIGFVNTSGLAGAAIIINASNNGYPIEIHDNSFVLFTKAIRVLQVDNMFIKKNFFNANVLAVSFECIGGYVLGPTVEENFILGGSGFDFPSSPADGSAPSGSYHCEGAFLTKNTVLVSASAATPAGATAPFSLRVQTGLDITSTLNTYGQNILGDGILLDAISGASITGAGITTFSSIDDWIDGASNTTGGVRYGIHVRGATFHTRLSGPKINGFTGYGIFFDSPSGLPSANNQIDGMRTYSTPQHNLLGDIKLDNAINNLISNCILLSSVASILETGSTLSIANSNLWNVAPTKTISSTYTSANLGPTAHT